MAHQVIERFECDGKDCQAVEEFEYDPDCREWPLGWLEVREEEPCEGVSGRWVNDRIFEVTGTVKGQVVTWLYCPECLQKRSDECPNQNP